MNKFLLLRNHFPFVFGRNHLFCSVVVSPTQDFYKLLGIQKSASQSDIKQAYYNLTLQYHPDKNKGDVEAARKFREVSEAYEILGNTFLRQKYDMNIPLHTIRGHKPPGDLTVRDLKYQQFFESRLEPDEYGDMRTKRRFDDEYFDSAKRYRKKPVSNKPFPEINDPERRMFTILLIVLIIISRLTLPELKETAYAAGAKQGFAI